MSAAIAKPRSSPPDLVSGPIAGGLMRLALPMLGASLLQTANGSINAIWVGRFLGESALAATATANLILFLLISGLFGLSMAAGLLVGQNAGRNDLQQLRRAVGTTCSVFLVAGVIFAAIGWMLAPQMLKAMITPDDVFPLALTYLRITVLAMPSAFLLVLMVTTLRSVGDSTAALWFMGLSAVLDAALNPLLITGVGALPRMGIAGSAVSTVIGSYVGCTGLLIYVYVKDRPIRLRGAEWRYLVPDGAILQTVLLKGVPMGLQSLVMTLSSLAVMGLVNRHGSMTAAAYAATSQLWSYMQMPAMAIAAAISAMAAQSIGAGRWDRINDIHRYGQRIAIATMLGGAGLMLLTDRYTLQLFLGAESEALDLATHINHIGIWSMALFGITCVPGAIVRANGAVLVPLLVLATSLYPVRIGFAIALGPDLGADAIWWSLVLGSALAYALTFAYHRWGRWRALQLVPAPRRAQLSRASAAMTG